MKHRNQPPLVILFDLLFMLLFVSVLKQERVLSIHLPLRYLPRDVEVLEGTNGSELAKKALTQFGGFGFLLPCTGQPECRYKSNWELGLALPSRLYQEISEISTTTFADGLCKRLTFHIRSDSSMHAIIDYQKLRINNPCLLKIEGFDRWLKLQQSGR